MWRICLMCSRLCWVSGGVLKNKVDICLNVPSNDTPRIQEGYMLAGHIICELVEKELFGK